MRQSSTCPFRHSQRKLITVLAVVARETIQKKGELEVIAPPGLGVDLTTGEFSMPVELEARDEPTLRIKVQEGKLINEGFLPVKLTIGRPCQDEPTCVSVRDLLIPFHSIVDIEGIFPGDHVQEQSEVESLSVFGIPVDDTSGDMCGVQTKLILKAILKARVVVAREEIINCMCAPTADGDC